MHTLDAGRDEMIQGLGLPGGPAHKKTRLPAGGEEADSLAVLSRPQYLLSSLPVGLVVPLRPTRGEPGSRVGRAASPDQQALRFTGPLLPSAVRLASLTVHRRCRLLQQSGASGLPALLSTSLDAQHSKTIRDGKPCLPGTDGVTRGSESR